MLIEGYDFDISDEETSKKFAKASLNAQRKFENYDKECGGKPDYVSIKFQCNIIRAFLCEVLGEGADKKILGEKNNLIAVMDTYEKIVLDALQKRNEMLNKARKLRSLAESVQAEDVTE
ncbi:MAG: hypothetical protein LBQ95_08670 [Lachnospiraceae bacterium]|jgi:hypothetical protein|nr:hypothetical protein [Lachnospiraceae bacterium]